MHPCGKAGGLPSMYCCLIRLHLDSVPQELVFPAHGKVRWGLFLPLFFLQSHYDSGHHVSDANASQSPHASNSCNPSAELHNNNTLAPIVYGLGSLFLAQWLIFSCGDANRLRITKFLLCVLWLQKASDVMAEIEWLWVSKPASVQRVFLETVNPGDFCLCYLKVSVC